MTRVLGRDSESSLLTAKELRPPSGREEGRALLSDQDRLFPLRLSGGSIHIQVLARPNLALSGASRDAASRPP